MIPTSFLSRLSLPSPQQTERDLARLIHRTIELDRRANRQLGYAAVNIGCDGVRRVTMFDGSSCQTSGDVCLATREEGITVCLDTPSGAGLAFQRIAFAAPACEPVTGWWIVDSEGYMYRVPQSLIDAAAYWPMSADPAVPAPAVTLVRSGTWAALMCGAGLTITLNGDGGAQWVNEGESPGEWTQIFAALMGGVHSQWTVLPTVTVDATTFEDLVDVTVSGGELILSGIVNTDGVFGSFFLDLSDGDLVPLVAGYEYTATVYLDSTGVVSVRGVQALAGTSVAPTVPSEALPIAEIIVPYDTTAATYTETGATGTDYGLGWTPTSGDEYTRSAADYRAVLLRDGIDPNAGLRVATVTLPAGGTGVVTGAVNVGYGYALGQRLDTAVPGVVGTWEADCVGRVVGDMAGAYRIGLAVEYGEGHICLDGAAITDADDYVETGEIDRTNGPALDVAKNVIGLPNTEIALLGESTGDIRSGKRYRVRPAPDTALTVTLEQQAKGSWGDDQNLWIAETYFYVDDWLAGATEFTVIGSGDATFPGRGVACILIEKEGTNPAVATYPCTLGPTSGGLTTLTLDSGSVTASTLAYPHKVLQIVGTVAYASWGWTFEVDGIESALSPLTDEGANGYQLTVPCALYSVKLTVPLGPTGTTARHIYRYLYSVGPNQVDTVGPWGTPIGGLYDRMLRRVATIGNNTTTEIYDEDISLSTAGTRPPSPLVYLGPIAVDAPRPVHLLQPMEL